MASSFLFKISQNKLFLNGGIFVGVVILSYYVSGVARHNQNMTTIQSPDFSAILQTSSADSPQVEPPSFGKPEQKRYGDLRDEFVVSDCIVPSDHQLGVSDCLHLLKVYGCDIVVRSDRGKVIPVLEILTDADKGASVFGETPIIKTPYGVRFPTTAVGDDRQSDETHRDQCLATFADLGLSLNTPIYVGHQKYSLLNVLQDSMANFHLKQTELEWSAVAYAKYLAPVTRQWTNRYGESYTFDSLAMEILNRPWERQSCGGLHCLMSLSALYRVDREHKILTNSVRTEVRAKLLEFAKIAISRQAENGSFHPGWTIPAGHLEFGDLPYRHQTISQDAYVLATGHACEWLLELKRDDDFDIPDKQLTNAVSWLSMMLKQSTAAVRWKSFCAWSHAVGVVSRSSVTSN